MMTFDEIMDALVYGRRIRREAWPEGVFMESDGSNVWMRSEVDGNRETLQRFCDGDRVFTLTDVCSDDWMFYY